MRSMLGKRDLFLSYAHIDIKFARKVKVDVKDLPKRDHQLKVLLLCCRVC